MTDKEKAKIEKMKKKSRDHGGDIAKVFPKEMVKYLSKKGYEVTKENFDYRSHGCKTPCVFQFFDKGEFVARYLPPRNLRWDWLENDLSLVKTLLSRKEEVVDRSMSRLADTKTFKTFLKAVKTYCKENGMYHEPENEWER